MCDTLLSQCAGNCLYIGCLHRSFMDFHPHSKPNTTPNALAHTRSFARANVKPNTWTHAKSNTKSDTSTNTGTYTKSDTSADTKPNTQAHLWNAHCKTRTNKSFEQSIRVTSSYTIAFWFTCTVSITLRSHSHGLTNGITSSFDLANRLPEAFSIAIGCSFHWSNRSAHNLSCSHRIARTVSLSYRESICHVGTFAFVGSSHDVPNCIKRAFLVTDSISFEPTFWQSFCHEVPLHHSIPLYVTDCHPGAVHLPKPHCQPCLNELSLLLPSLRHQLGAFNIVVGIRLVLHSLVQKEPGDDALIASVHGA